MNHNTSRSDTDFTAEAGFLKLSLAPSSQLPYSNRPKTTIKCAESKAPLLIQRALYPEPSYPFLAHIYMMSSAGGILQGDRLNISIESEPHSYASVTTQASTKIYRMDRGYATQQISLRINKDAYLEFLPHSNIPYKGSKFHQTTSIQADTGSVLVYSETMSAGRIAFGERFDFNSLELQITARHSSGKLLFHDSSKFRSMRNAGQSFNHAAQLDKLFGKRDILSTVYIVSPSSDQTLTGLDEDFFQLLQTEREFIAKCGSSAKSAFISGISSLPNNSGLVIRMLSNSIDQIESVISRVSRICRKQFLS
ncbi:MAG: urease accessory protein UreD [Nitrososphaera sp.]